jgi:integrase
MAHAEKRGKSWRVRYKLPSGEFASESGFPTKSAALKRGNDLEADVRHGRFVDPRKARTPFGEFVPVFMEAQDVAPNTTAKRRRLLKTHLLPKWEHVPLCDINLFVAKAWSNQLDCAASTRRHVMTLLSMILTAAADAGYLLANPLYGRRLSKKAAPAAVVDREKVYAQPTEVHQVAQRLGGADDVRGLMVITDAFTGLRWGELAGLHKSNCLLLRRDRLADGNSFIRHVIRVDPFVGSLHEVEVELTGDELAVWRAAEDERIAKGLAAGRAPRRRKDPETRIDMFLGPPKNATSAREVDVPPFLVGLLTEHMARWPHEYPFCTPSGEGAFWRRGNFGADLRPAADGRTAVARRQGTAGREAWEPIRPGMTMRSLRGSHDTWLKEDRVDRALRYQNMGWATDDIEGVYERVTPDMRRARLDGLERRWLQALRGWGAPLREAVGS